MEKLAWTPDDALLTALVIESVGYLPALRRMFPHAELCAVAADADAASAAELEGLGVHWTTLDYRETVLPFPRGSFDFILSERMLDYWTNFVKTGDPNGAGLPRWERLETEDDIMVFDTET